MPLSLTHTAAAVDVCCCCACARACVRACVLLLQANKAKDGEVARARAAEEAAMERAKGFELQLTSLKKKSDAAGGAAGAAAAAAAAGAASGGGAAAASDDESVEAKWQAALVKLGTAEQRAVTARTDFATKESEVDALMSEVEALSQEYETMQGTNPGAHTQCPPPLVCVHSALSMPL